MSGSEDISGMCERIMANVATAFPLVSPSGISPTADSDGSKYRIITRRKQRTPSLCFYQAVVLYGTDNSFFIGGISSIKRSLAIESLLEATEDLIQELYDKSKLTLFVSWDGKHYDPNAGVSFRAADMKEGDTVAGASSKAVDMEENTTKS